MFEQRKSRRFDLRLPIELLRNGSDPMLAAGETVNVSSAGVLFRCGAPIAPGDSVEYTISLPTSSNEVTVRLRCKGKVVRSAEQSETAATMDRWEFRRERCPRPV